MVKRLFFKIRTDNIQKFYDIYHLILIPSLFLIKLNYLML